MVIAMIINFISAVFYVYEILIFVRCILSFFPGSNVLTRWVYMATEPVLSPCRKLLDKFNINLPLDFSPMLALLLMQFVQRIIINVLYIFMV